MGERIVRKHKLFFAWQDENQEAWLAGMSRRGLHLKGPGSFGSFTFLEGSPREMAYCLDFNRERAPEEYIQLIQDAGWEVLGQRSGWYYWRKEIQGAKIPVLFSDAESKIQKYNRLFLSFTASAPGVSVMYIITAAVFKRFPGRHPLWFVILCLGLFIGWIAFAAVNAIKIQMRINELRQEKAQ